MSENVSKWEELSIDTNSLETTVDKSKSCRLFRGNENLLLKIEELNSSQKEIKEEGLKKAKEEIRALCSQWLKMQNVCALLGAGASRYITGFVGSEMYERIKKLLEKRESRIYLELIEKNFSSDTNNISKYFEDFLSQLILLEKLLGKGEKPLDNLNVTIKDNILNKNQLSNLILDIERAIIVLCNVSCSNNNSLASFTPHDVFVSKLISRDPQQGRGKIFTTNYDTLIEQAMDRMGIEYLDGFTGNVKRRFNPSAYDLDYYYPGEITEGRVRRYDKVLHLYKTHGSINWRRVLPDIGNPYGISFETNQIPTDEEITKNPALLDTVLQQERLSILPTSAKYGESITMPYAHLFRTMAQSLRESQTVCFVIGYSGWDIHVNQIFEDALTNPGFVCVIVNSSITEWAKKLLSSDYCGRVYAFEGKLGEFEFFAEQVLPDIEIMKTDIAIAKTIRALQKYRIDEAKS